jgi:hypothetical protein
MFPKTFLSVKEVTDLLNEDDSDLDVGDNIDDLGYLDQIILANRVFVAITRTTIQRETFDESEEVEQPDQKYTVNKDIQWHRRELIPNPVIMNLLISPLL